MASKWQVSRGVHYVHMRKKIYYHPLKLSVEAATDRWKRYSFLLGLHVVDISWSVLEEKVILTGDCFSSTGHQW